MIYVFDTSPLSVLFKHYYRGRFPTLWLQFEGMVRARSALSVREVRAELLDSQVEDRVKKWAANFPDFFTTPTTIEALFLNKIYSVHHFQQNIGRKKLLAGGKNADSFVIAKANAVDGTVVTLEKRTQTGARIPDICDHFEIPCISLEKFMEDAGWRF